MKYVIGSVAVLAAIGTAAYFYMQDQDGQKAEARNAERAAAAEETAEAI
jgi:uncharacterized protein (UPF0333 family)